MPQLYTEFEVDEGSPLSGEQLENRLRDKRFDIFDRVCQRFKMSPRVLAQQPAHELVSMIRTVIGQGAQIVAETIRDQAAEYATA
jgi:DNA-binding response OmpR family regulator